MEGEKKDNYSLKQKGRKYNPVSLQATPEIRDYLLLWLTSSTQKLKTDNFVNMKEEVNIAFREQKLRPKRNLNGRGPVRIKSEGKKHQLTTLSPSQFGNPKLQPIIARTQKQILVFFSFPIFVIFLIPYRCTYSDQQRTIIFKGFIFKDNERDWMGKLSYFTASLGRH